MRNLLLLTYLLLPAASMAGDLTLVYDAQNPEKGLRVKGAENDSGSGALRNLRIGAQVLVEIENANTFTHKYAVNVSTIDEYTTSAPKALADLVVTTKPLTRAPLPTLGDGAFAKAVEAFLTQYQKVDADFGGLQFDPQLVNIDKKFESIAYASNGVSATYPNWALTYVMHQRLDEVVSGDAWDEASTITHEMVGDREGHLKAILQSLKANLRDKIKNFKKGLGQDMDDLKAAYLTVVGKLTDPSAPDKPATVMEQIEKIYAQANADFADVGNDIKGLTAKIESAEGIAKAATKAPEIIKLGPFEAQKDQTKFVLQITPSDAFVKLNSGPEANSPPLVKQVPRSFDIYGRQVLDFSMGLVGTSFERQNYYKRDTTDDATANPTIHKGPRDKGDIGFGAFAHYYTTTPSGRTLAPTIGLALNNSSIRALLGVSYVMSSGDNRSYFTIGMAFGETERLNGYKVGEVIDGDIKTVKVNRTGYFIGVSFNFLSK
jgi:hypothetical protein